jgi:phenylalanyl-tRNA synthetase beta subunit
MEVIKKQSPLIMEVSLLDKYQDTRTFHIIYQSYEKNLTNEEVGEIRKKILKSLREKLHARLKE